MPVIEAQCASILVPHDHRHINHESEIWVIRLSSRLLLCVVADDDQAQTLLDPGGV